MIIFKKWKCRYANSKLKVRSKISKLINSDGTYTETPDEQMQLLNEYFSSGFTKEDLDSIGTFGKSTHNTRHGFIKA